MKQKTRLWAVCMAVCLILPCMAQQRPRVPGPRNQESVNGVRFVLKIDAATVLNDPQQELIALVEAFGSRDDSQAYRARVTSVNLRESPYSLGVFVEELSEDADGSVFANRLAAYMGHTMEAYFEQTYESLHHRLDKLDDQKFEAAHRLKTLRAQTVNTPKMSPARQVLQNQLDTIIDLGEFTPELPAAAAFDILRESVSPPLNLVVLWKDLFENAEIEPTTPIDMDGTPQVSLGTALDVLLKALGGGFYELAYRVQDSVIVVGTKGDTQSSASDTFLSLASVEYTSFEEINDRRRELALELDDLEMDISVKQANQTAVVSQVSQIRTRITTVLANDPVLKDFESLLMSMESNLDTVKEDPEAYVRFMERLVALRMKVAEHKANLIERSGGQDMADFNRNMRNVSIELAEDMARFQALKQQLSRVEKELAQSVRLRSTVNEIKTTEEALAGINKQLEGVQGRIMGLERPSVTCLGL